VCKTRRPSVRASRGFPCHADRVTPPPDIDALYAAPTAALVVDSPEADALRAARRKLRRVAMQGGLVALACSAGIVGVVSGYFTPGRASFAFTDPVEVLVVGALAVGAVSGLLGTATALFGSSLVEHGIEHTQRDARRR